MRRLSISDELLLLQLSASACSCSPLACSVTNGGRPDETLAGRKPAVSGALVRRAQLIDLQTRKPEEELDFGAVVPGDDDDSHAGSDSPSE